MSTLSEFEERLLAEVSRDTLWQHAEAIARWEKVSGTPGERAAVDYLRRRLEEYGTTTSLYEIECLLGWPEEVALEIRHPVARPIEAVVHAYTPSTPPEGIEAEVVYLGAGTEADFQRQPVAGKVVLIEGMVTPAKVLLGQTYGVAGEVFVVYDRLRDFCISPVWGTPTTKTAGLLPNFPAISIGRQDGEDLRALVEMGSVRVRLRTKTFWDWRTVPLLVGDIPGTAEAERFVLLSGHHCSWYYGAMDNGTANATMLEVARVLSRHRQELRRGVRIAFWPAHTQGRYSGSTWYADQFWEDLHDNCVLHVNADSTGARGATLYRALCMAETRDLAVAAIADAVGAESEPERIPRAGDQSFWGCGIPSIFMDLSNVPPELAANLGSSNLFTAAGQAPAHQAGGLPWWWHTPDDTIDKIDPDVLVRDTRVYLLATLRPATAPILPFRYGPTAREIRETLERYQAAAGDHFDLGSVIGRAERLEATATALDDLLDQVRRQAASESLADIANRGLMALSRALVPINFTASGPFDHDLAVPIPPVPLLEPVRRLKSLDPAASEARYLAAELTRNRNKVAFALRQALEAVEETTAAIRRALASAVR